jgi:hypothetical protein
MQIFFVNAPYTIQIFSYFTTYVFMFLTWIFQTQVMTNTEIETHNILYQFHTAFSQFLN